MALSHASLLHAPARQVVLPIQQHPSIG